MSYSREPSHVIPVSSGGLGDETNIVSISLTRNLSGGNFSIRGKFGELVQPYNQTRQLSSLGGFAPTNSRMLVTLAKIIGIVETYNSVDYSLSGLLATVEGRLSPFAAQQYVAWVFIRPNLDTITQQSQNNQPISFPGGQLLNGQPVTSLATAAANLGIQYLATDFPIREFSFNGKRVDAAGQLASSIGGDVIVYNGNVYVVPKNFTFGSFAVPDALVQSYKQRVTSQYSVAVVPANIPVQFDVRDYVYDNAHSSPQSPLTVECGMKSGRFIEVPSGWMVDGTYEEWFPTGTNNANPAPTVSRYWKIFPSPTNKGYLRGIKTFTRLCRDLNLNNLKPTQTTVPIRLNTSQTVATSPETLSGFSLGTSFGGISGGYNGFKVARCTGTDILTDKPYDFAEGMALTANGADANKNYFYANFLLRTFPLVTPPQYVSQFDPNDPTSPLFLGAGVKRVSAPMSITQAHNNYYASQMQLGNSDRLMTDVTFIDDGLVDFPQPGDGLYFRGQFVGRITSASKNQSSGGSIFSVSAELLYG